MTSDLDRRTGLFGLLLCVLCLAYLILLGSGIGFDYSHFTPIFFTLLYFYDTQTAALAVLVCLAAMLWRKPAPVLRLVDFLDRHAAGTAAVSAALLAGCAVGVYRNHPLSMDEYAAVFQSRVFASGHLVAQFPTSLVPWLTAPGYNGYFLLISPQTGRAIEAYWPGFALVLAPFQWMAVPWLCNAVLAGLGVYLVHRITLEVSGDRRTAGWAVLFMLGSSAVWANAISYYSMQAHLTANLLYACLLLKPSIARSFTAGLVGSLALMLHNPVPHTLFAAPWVIALVWDANTRRRLMPLAAGYLPGIAVILFWSGLRGEIAPASQGAAAWRVLQSVFVLPDADIFNMRAAAAAKMWVWAVPCVFYFALLGWVRARDNRHIQLLMLSALSTFAGYLFVKLDQGHGWGYRYFYSAWGVVPILAACALTGRSEEERGLVTFAGAAAVLSLLILVPFQLFQIGELVTEHLAKLPPAQRPGGNVYFIDSRLGYYLGDLIQMDPLLRSEDLYLATQGQALDADLMHRNWPNAVRCGGAAGVVQWCLGDAPTAAQSGHLPH